MGVVEEAVEDGVPEGGVDIVRDLEGSASRGACSRPPGAGPQAKIAPAPAGTLVEDGFEASLGEWDVTTDQVRHPLVAARLGGTQYGIPVPSLAVDGIVGRLGRPTDTLRKATSAR